MKTGLLTFAVFVPLFGALIGSDSPNDWAEGTPDSANGATRDYYNRAGLLEWKNKLGDWHDAKGVAQGNEPYAKAVVTAEHKGKAVEWDVTRLAQEWLGCKVQNQGMLLRVVGGGGNLIFGSREQIVSANRPQLMLTGDKGSLTLAPQADTFLDRSTYRSLGRLDHLKISSDPIHALLRFDLRGTDEVGKLRSAILRLHNLARYGGPSLTVGVFRCAPGQDVPSEEPTPGLAAKYPGDTGIRNDPAVVFFADFESANWTQQWSEVGDVSVLATLAADADRKFQPLQAKALRAKIAKGGLSALNMTYKFKKETGAEPEQIYFRYYLRLADDWNQTIEGGKLPGISGTYNVAGWGGRRSNGSNGWSARGAFQLSIPDDNPLAGLHPIGTYCYHADMAGDYGDIWVWHKGYRGFLEKNRWYSIEQYVKLNTPREKDGILRAWVDGRLAFEKTDLRFRNVDRLKIEQIWMNVYHGGKAPSPYDQHLFIDNVVIAREYIGPMK